MISGFVTTRTFTPASFRRAERAQEILDQELAVWDRLSEAGKQTERGLQKDSAIESLELAINLMGDSMVYLKEARRSRYMSVFTVSSLRLVAAPWESSSRSRLMTAVGAKS